MTKNPHNSQLRKKLTKINISRYSILQAFMMACMLFIGCIPEDIDFPSRVKSITTNDVTDISTNRATLNGSVMLSDTDTISCGVLYNTSPTLSNKSGVQKSTTANGNYSVSIDGLIPNTTYYYRAYTVELGRYMYGTVRSFNTKQVVTVTTGDATNITVSGATLSGTVHHAEQPIECGFIYSKSTSPTHANGIKVSTKSNGDYSINISDLEDNTTYYYLTYAVIDGKYKYGEVQSFKTKLFFSVATGNATNITYKSAILSGTVQSSGQPITCGIIYNTSSTLSNKDGIMKTTTSSSDFTIEITELAENTTYYYCAYAVVDNEYKFGDICSFNTKQVVTVTTGDATNITVSGATLSGTVHHAEQPIECGFIYSKSAFPTPTNGTKVSTKSNGDYSINISDLEDNTTYYYHTYAVIDGKHKYGEVQSFKTKLFFSVATGGASNITSDAVTISGTVSSSGQTITCGIIYGTSSTLSATSGTLKSTTANGAYSIDISGLSGYTTYYYCAYAVVDGEYKYGKVQSFKTNASVITDDAISITENGATLCGVVNGGGSVTCGIIYGTSMNLSTTSGTILSTTANGKFSFAVSGLNHDTNYFYCAYAIIDGVYMYGKVRSFRTRFPISVVTGNISSIKQNCAVAEGTVNSSGHTITCGMIYGTSSTLSSTNGTMKSTTSSGGSFTVELDKLDERTYYYRAYAVFEGEYKYGEVRSFNTNVSIVTNDATNITENEATFYGAVNNGGQPVTCGIIYGTSMELLTTSGTKLSTTANGEYSFVVSDLNPYTNYFYCAYAVVDGIYRYGEIRSFRTKLPFSVATGNVANITQNSAITGGTVKSNGYTITCGIVYGTSSTVSSTNGTMKSTTSSGHFTIELDDLDEGTWYYYRAYAVVDGEYKYGQVYSFNTKIHMPADAVDLGLSVKWASYNIGASAPEDYGRYYAWGEIVEKKDYSWTTYKWSEGSEDKMTKYNSSDKKVTLDIEDDIANKKWGSNWRMPTNDEFNELINKCSWQWTTINGVSGYRVTGTNGNWIFLPAAGYCYGEGTYNRGVSGNYWINTCYWDRAYYLVFGSSSYEKDFGYRNYGFTVRPVTE